jgi:transcriptional regulator with XRE-family HTH domain
VSGAPQTAAALRDLQHRLAGAQDGQIKRVVAMVDALPERGAADRLIAPLRPRLAQLRPARPLRFCRLLFLPLDPLIVPAPKWRPLSLTIPRSVLEPLAVSVRDAMGPEVKSAVDAAIAGHTTRDTETVREAGAVLWPIAGRILCAAPASRSWHTTGLPAAEHPALARAAGAVILHGVTLHEIADTSREGREPQEKLIETLLCRSALHGPETVSRVMAVLLESMPHAEATLRLAAAGVGFIKGLMRDQAVGERNRGVGGRIGVARREKGWTQQALADAVGVSRNAVAQWETNRSGQIPGNLTRLAAALGTSVEWLMHGTEAPTLVEAGSRDELAILRLYRECSTEDRRVARHTIELLAARSEIDPLA